MKTVTPKESGKLKSFLSQYKPSDPLPQIIFPMCLLIVCL